MKTDENILNGLFKTERKAVMGRKKTLNISNILFPSQLHRFIFPAVFLPKIAKFEHVQMYFYVCIKVTFKSKVVKKGYLNPYTRPQPFTNSLTKQVVFFIIQHTSTVTD